MIKTFSKIYGLAGARISYALADIKTIDKLSHLQSGSNMGISSVALTGVLASLKDNNFVKEAYLQNAEARAFTLQHLERSGIH